MNKNRMEEVMGEEKVVKHVLFDKEDFKKISKEIENSKGYFLGITILNKNDMLRHYLVANNFPKIDMLKSLKKIKNLVIMDLERETNDDKLLDEVNF